MSRPLGSVPSLRSGLSHPLPWLLVALAGTLLGASGTPEAQPAPESAVDPAAILEARDTPASGPGDPRDLDRDGRITVLDARLAVVCGQGGGCVDALSASEDGGDAEPPIEKAADGSPDAGGSPRAGEGKSGNGKSGNGKSGEGKSGDSAGSGDSGARSAAEETEDPRMAEEARLEPFDTDTNTLGDTDSAHGLSINTFTGKVAYRLGSFGVPGSAVDAVYKTPNRVRDQGVLAPDVDHGALGPGWNLGFGYLLSKRVVVDSSGPEKVVRPEEVVLVSAGGDAIAFEVDEIFQTDRADTSDAFPADHGLCEDPQVPGSCADPTPYRDAHFIDASLRRLTRQVYDQHGEPHRFGHGVYRLLETDGTVITFTPSRFPGPSSATARFYPTRIERPNGRALRLDYCNTLVSFSSNIARLCKVEDEWGRVLELVRDSTVEGQEHLVTRIVLHASASSFAPKRVLARFDYSLDPASQRWILSAYSTPMGYTTRFGYQDVAESIYPYLSSITNDAGATLGVTYGAVELWERKKAPRACPGPLCDPDAERLVKKIQSRPLTVRHDPGFGQLPSSYHYVYEQTCLDGTAPDICAPTGSISTLEYSRLRVTVSLDSAEAQGEIYERVTDYLGPSVRGVDDRGDLRSVGQPEIRTVRYRSRHLLPDGSRPPIDERVERWRYQTEAGDEEVLGLPLGTLPADHEFASLYSENGGVPVFSAPATVAYSVEADGRTVENLFFYPTIHTNPQLGGRAVLGASSRSVRYVRQDGGWSSDTERHLQVVRFEHRMRTEPLAHDQDESPDTPHILGLSEWHEADFLRGDGSVEPRGIVETFYASEPTRPLVERTLIHASDGSDPQQTPDIEQRFTYHDALLQTFPTPIFDPAEGLVETVATGAGPTLSVTEYPSYQFGQPAEELPPVGAKLDRNVHYTGTVAWEKLGKDSVFELETRYEYDDDRRPVRESTSGLADEITTYSAPSQAPEVRSNFGDSESVALLDGFGRKLESRGLVQIHPQTGERVETTARSEHSALGLADRVVDPRGTEAVTLADVHGRTIRRIWRDAAGKVIRDVETLYAASGDRSTVTEIRREMDGATVLDAIEVTTTFDFADRPLRVATRRSAHLGPSQPVVETLYVYEAPNLVRVRPEGRTDVERVSRSNWQGQLLEEHHPELDGPVRYFYNDRGELIEEIGPEEHFTFLRDPIGRLLEKHSHLPGGETVVVEERAYHEVYGIPSFGRSEHGVEVVIPSEPGAWHPSGLPQVVDTTIPPLAPAPAGLEHERLDTGDDALRLSWSAAGLGNGLQMEVELLAGSEPVWSRVLPITAVVPTETFVPANVVNPLLPYTFRVRGIDAAFQPTAWAATEIAPGSPGQASTAPSPVVVAGVAISPGSLAFGALPLGQSSTLPLTLHNTSSAPVALAASYFGPPFDITPRTFELAAGEVRQAQVSFAPTVAGPALQPMAFVAPSGESATVVLSGHGYGAAPQGEMWIPGPPQSSTDYTRLDFGHVFVGESAVRFTAIRNVGGPGTLLQELEVSFYDPRLSMVEEPGIWPPPALENAEWIYPKIRFTADDSLGPVSATATFSIPLDDGSRQAIEVELHGRVLGEAQIEVRSQGSSAALSHLDFGSISLGQEATGFFEVHNTGTLPVEVHLTSTDPFEVVQSVVCVCPDPQAADCSGTGAVATTPTPYALDVVLPPQAEPGVRTGTIEVSTRDFCTGPPVPRTAFSTRARVVETPPLEITWGSTRFRNAGLYSWTHTGSDLTVRNLSGQPVQVSVAGRGDLALFTGRSELLRSGASYTYQDGVGGPVPRLGEYGGELCVAVEGFEPLCRTFTGFGEPLIGDFNDNWPAQQLRRGYPGQPLVWHLDLVTREVMDGSIAGPLKSRLEPPSLGGATNQLSSPRPEVILFESSIFRVPDPWTLGRFFELSVDQAPVGLHEERIRVEAQLPETHLFAPGLRMLRDFPIRFEVVPFELEHTCCTSVSSAAGLPPGAETTSTFTIRNDGALPLRYKVWLENWNRYQPPLPGEPLDPDLKEGPFRIESGVSGTLSAFGGLSTVRWSFRPKTAELHTMDLVIELIDPVTGYSIRELAPVHLVGVGTSR